jgi:hypothetical protein
VARRKIIVELDEGTTEPEEYAKLANVIWSVASLDKNFVQVSFDGEAKAEDLNGWYDDNDGSARWSDS